MQNKEIYVAPEMEIVRFESEDVIATSGIEGPFIPANQSEGQW